MTITVIVQKCAAGTPLVSVPLNSAVRGDVGEPAVAIVVKERVLTPIGHVHIFKSIVVDVADADTISPSGSRHAGLDGRIVKTSASLVVEEMVCWSFAISEAFKARPVHQKNILPTVAIVIEKRNARAIRFDDVLFRLLVSGSKEHCQPRALRNINEAHGERPT